MVGLVVKKSPTVGLVVKREASASVAGVQQLIGTFTENQEKQSWSPKTKLEPQSPGEGKRNKKKRNRFLGGTSL